MDIIIIVIIIIIIKQEVKHDNKWESTKAVLMRLGTLFVPVCLSVCFSKINVLMGDSLRDARDICTLQGGATNT